MHWDFHHLLRHFSQFFGQYKFLYVTDEKPWQRLLHRQEALCYNGTVRNLSSSVFVLFSLLLFVLVCPSGAYADKYQDYQNNVSAAGQAAENGDEETALRHYLAAFSEFPDADLPKSALVGMLSNGMPEQIDLSLLRSIPLTPLPYTVATFELPEADAQATIVTPRASVSLHEVSDPQNGWPFAHVLYVYRSDSADNGHAQLFCAVHYQTSDDQSLARRAGTLLFLLRAAYLQKMAERPVGDDHSFQVWLCRRAPDTGGGEEWHHNLYFYDTGDKRSSIEWIREIAHEYSHLAFPAIGGNYTAPEAWANGYLGERLLVRWLARGAAGGSASVERAWGDTFSGYPTFARILVTPDEQLYEDH